MSTPLFLDFTKNLKNLFEKGFYFDQLKLDIKTKATPGIEFSFGGVQDLTSMNVLGTLEARYKFKDHGITFVEKWNTNNVLATEISMDDYREGVKVSCETYFVPTVGRKRLEDDRVSIGRRSQEWSYTDKMMQLKGSYKNSGGQLDFESDFKTGTKPILRIGASLNHRGFFAGCGGIFDYNNNRIKEHVIGGGFTIMGGAFTGLMAIRDSNVISGMTLYRFGDVIEIGMQASLSLNSKARELGVACKYFLDEDSHLRIKITQKAEIGVSYSQKINKSATVFLSTIINSANTTTLGSYHLGFCLELEA